MDPKSLCGWKLGNGSSQIQFRCFLQLLMPTNPRRIHPNPPKWSCGRLDQQRISFFVRNWKNPRRNPTKIRKKSNKSTQVYLWWWCGLLDRQRPTAAGFCHKPGPPPIHCQGFPALERALCRIITKFKLHSQVSISTTFLQDTISIFWSQRNYLKSH